MTVREATAGGGEGPCPHCRKPMRLGAPCPACARDAVVCGEYHVDEVLGRGGMGLVYGATRQADGTPVAVKVLWLGDGVDFKTHELFERSTRVLQGLVHPGLPTVHAFERDDAGRLVLVRERFDGGSLAERVRRGRRVDATTLRHVLDSMLHLLEYLHAQLPPVFHRDIKPENIMFRTAADWEPVLVDFDTVAAPGPQQGRLTIVCTPGYSAPEQLAGDVSPASDLYSLGATMLFVATHTEPDLLPRAEGRFQVAEQLEALDAATRAVVLRLVEPAKERRFHCAADALRALAPPAPLEPARARAVERPASRDAERPDESAAEPSRQQEAGAPGLVRPGLLSRLNRDHPVGFGVVAAIVIIGGITAVLAPLAIMAEDSASGQHARRLETPVSGETPSAVAAPSAAAAAPSAAPAAPPRATLTGRATPLWQADIPGGPLWPPRYRTHGDGVFVVSRSGALHALELASGKERWRRSDTPDEHHLLRVAWGTLIWAHGNRLAVIDYANGAIHFQLTTPEPVSDVAGFRDQLLAVTRAGTFGRLDMASRELITQAKIGAEPSSLCVDGWSAYVGTKTGMLHSIYPHGGNAPWRAAVGRAPIRVLGRDKNVVCLAERGDSGEDLLRGVSAADGRPVWSIPFGHIEAAEMLDWQIRAVAAEPNEDIAVHLITCETGARGQRHALPATGGVLQDEVAYQRTSDRLYATTLADGAQTIVDLPESARGEARPWAVHRGVLLLFFPERIEAWSTTPAAAP
jgi:hypothetical protein